MYPIHVEATMHSTQVSIILVKTITRTAIARSRKMPEVIATTTNAHGAIASTLGAAVASAVACQTIGSTVLTLDDAVVGP